MIEFAVRAKHFETYERFTKQINKLGVKYADKFVPFKEKSMEDNNCLYFSTSFDGVSDSKRLKYRFSNTDEVTLIFNIDNSATAFKSAYDYVETQICKTK